MGSFEFVEKVALECVVLHTSSHAHIYLFFF